MITELPEQLISQAEFLLREAAFNEANVRRAVSSAYYALFHLLIRDAVVNWKHADQHARLARSFDHKRMKDASTAILKEMGNIPIQSTAGADAEQAARFRLSTVACPLSTCSRRGTRPITMSESRLGPSMRRWMSRRPAWPF